MHNNGRQWAAFAGSVALAFAAVACERSSNATRDSGAVGTSGTLSDRQAAVTVTGCVQENRGMLGGDYILTQVNHVNGPVATSGASGSDAAVRHEQERAAAKSYRLDGADDQLKDLVGKQVQVKGRITDQADTGMSPDAATADRDRDRGMVDRDRNRDRAGVDRNRSYAGDRGTTSDIDASNLAELRVDSLTKVGDTCGASGK